MSNARSHGSDGLEPLMMSKCLHVLVQLSHGVVFLPEYLQFIGAGCIGTPHDEQHEQKNYHPGGIRITVRALKFKRHAVGFLTALAVCHERYEFVCTLIMLVSR